MAVLSARARICFARGILAGMTSDTVRVALITVVGSVAVALITTLGTITLSSHQIKDNQQNVSDVEGKLSALKAEADNLAKPGIPVGTIVASILTPEEFAKAVGDPSNLGLAQSNWTLANGKDVAGTDYVEVAGKSSVPDLQGVFLRGQNNGRFPNVEQIALGEYRQDVVGFHTHNQAVFNPNSPNQKNDAGIVYDTTHRTTVTPDLLVKPDGTGLGPETVPKNVTVNYFIRINN